MIRGIRKEGLSTDAFFQTVFQSSPDAAVIARICDATIMHVNDSFCRITGFSREEVVGKTTLELKLYYDPSDRDRFLASMAKTGILEPHPAFLRKRDGSKYAALISARAFWSEGYEYVCASIRDTSEELRLEREQSERDEEYRRLFETMTQGVVYQDAEGNILSANPAAERMLGVSLAEMSKRTSFTPEWKTINEDRTPLPGCEHPSMVALRTGKPYGPKILGVYNAVLGDYVWLSVSATPLFRNGEEKPFQVYGIMDDITATRRAQQDFQQLFHEMVDASALHEIICDDNGKPIDYRFLALNPAFERMTGLKGEDLIGKRVLEALPGTEQYWIDAYGHVALTGQPVTFQNYAVTLGKYFKVTAYRPAPMQFACTFIDVTHQIRLEQEKELALEHANRLAHICDVAPCSLIVHDAFGNILYTNDYTFRLYGYDEAEFLSRPLNLSVGEETSQSIQQSSAAVLEKGHIVLQRTAIAKDGRQIPLLIYTKQIIWDGNPVMLSIGTDLTEQKKAEKDLQTSLAQTQRILNHLQDGFYQAKLDGTFIRLNPRMAQIYGYASIDEMLQFNAKSMYADLTDRASMFEKLEKEGRVTSHVCLGKRKDGSTFWVSMHVQSLKDESGEIIGTEGLIRDITEQKKLEEEIEKQHEFLKETNEVLKKRLEQSINAISKVVELRDVYTSGHQKRVMQLACQIGSRIGMSEDAITNLSYGALIHDIGKIYIASDILNKPGKITNLEYQILQTHAEYSYNIAKEMDLPQVILTMVLQHQERLDGSGYPRGCKGDEIILESRILSVADVVEAMTSHRPYRPALGIDAALAEIEAGKGVKYDALVVEHCIAIFREQGFSFSYDA